MYHDRDQWMYDLPGVEVRTLRLPDDEMGGWIHELQMIVLDDRLTGVQARSTHAHEAIHALRGDQCCTGLGPDGDRLQERQERLADRLAALRLVALERLAQVLASTDTHADAAAELDVDETTLWNRLEALDDQEKAYLQARVEDIEEKSWPMT